MLINILYLFFFSSRRRHTRWPRDLSSDVCSYDLIGDKDDYLNNENREIANTILEEWFHDFEKRNPNLKVYNAVIHNDEASPHMHLNFVPVASGYKRGLEKQVAFRSEERRVGKGGR